jgi:hypothetical protein
MEHIIFSVSCKSLPNKVLHRRAIPLRSFAAGELGRYTFFLPVIIKVEG